MDLFIQLAIELEKLVSSGDLEEFCKLNVFEVKATVLIKTFMPEKTGSYRCH